LYEGIIDNLKATF